MELDNAVSPEAAKAVEEEAKKQGSNDISPLAEATSGAADVAVAAADGAVGAVIDGVGAVLSGAADVVGGIFSIFDV